MRGDDADSVRDDGDSDSDGVCECGVYPLSIWRTQGMVCQVD